MFISLTSLRHKMIIDCLKYVNITYLLLIFGHNYNLQLYKFKLKSAHLFQIRIYNLPLSSSDQAFNLI